MVHFEPADEVTPISAARGRAKARARPRVTAETGAADSSAKPNSTSNSSSDSTDTIPTGSATDAHVAPVTYLHPAGTRHLGAAASFGAEPDGSEPDGSEPDGSEPDDAEADREDTLAAAAVEREHAEQVLRQRLRGRSLSVLEARTVLAGTEIATDEIDEVLERFTDLGYIDERRLADQILHSHHERKGLGRGGVQTEMRRRGLDHDLILEKLDELPDDEAERAIELACKRVTQMGRLDNQTIDRRLTGFLMRKGYSSGSVRLAVKAALESRSGSAGSTPVRFR